MMMMCSSYAACNDLDTEEWEFEDAQKLNDFIPSDEEARDIKSSLSRAKARMSEIEGEITRLKQQLDALEVERVTVAKDIARSNILIAPYKRLPLELLSLIFTACVVKPLFLPASTSQAPLLLCRVSRRWRQLSLGMHQLWCDVAVNIGQSGKLNYTLAAARAFFMRSQCLPLSMEVNGIYTGHFGTDPDEDRSPLMDLVIPVVSRIRTLKLGTLSEVELNRLLSLPPESFEKLEDLSLLLHNAPINGAPLEAPNPASFEAAPRLRSIAIGQHRGSLDLRHLPFPWAQLRSITISSALTDLIYFHTVLRQCKELQRLNVRLAPILDNQMPELLSLEKTVLPCLQTCVVQFKASRNHTGFIAPLVLPSLRHLEIRFDRPCDVAHGWSQDSYASLVSRSSCVLEDLYVGLNTLELDISLILECTPKLKGLYIADQVRPSTRTLEKIATGELGPSLVKLRLSVALLDPILSMLETRCRIGSTGVVSQIRVLDISCPEPNTQQILRLDRLRASGLHVTMSHHGYFRI